jgi:Winged helix DNA-binding domain
VPVWHDVAVATRTIGADERRARLGQRHRLAPSALAVDAVEAADGVVALHGTDPSSVYLATVARMRAPAIEPIETALYDERSLVRMLGMRRTMFVVARGVAPVVQAACTRAIAAQQRRLLVQHLTGAGVASDCAAWLTALEEATLAALNARGEATAAELADDVPLLRTSLLMATGKPYEAQPYVTTRVLFLLAADGRIIRGRPRGSWTSSQYRWAPLHSWLPGGLTDWPTEAAQVELARLWLRRFGPATVDDLKWWTGWTLGQTRKALAQLAPVEVDLSGVPGLVLPDDVDPVVSDEPWIALLPALDPTAMGWAARDWYVGPHTALLFDRSGNIGPTVWSDGRIIGGWAQRKDGSVAYQLLDDVGTEVASSVAAAAERLGLLIGTVRVTPRFRTPLERDLSA